MRTTERWHANLSEQEIVTRAKFGEEFRALRKSLGLSKSEMAEEIHVSREVIVKIEAGCVSPNLPGRIQERIKAVSSKKKLIIA